jgi:TonB family protein
MVQDTENSNRLAAWSLSLLFHGIVIGLLFIIVMHTPVPPYPVVGGGSGLEVNFGTSDEGMGDVQPEEYLPVDTKNLEELQQQSAAKESKAASQENILTQDVEEAPSVATSDKKEESKQLKEIKINDPVVNPNALYKKSSNARGGSEGETGKPGDQGNPGGNLYSKNHYGEPGSGAGTGSGYGVGTGSGNGVGPAFDLSGRTSKYLPKPDYRTYETGTVVVKIWVNKQGIVIRAEAGARGTTTSSQVLQKLAQQAALKAKFSPDPNAPEEQKGTITYHFVLQN